MNLLYVIAGTFAQFDHFVFNCQKENKYDGAHFVYVKDYHTLRGIVDPWGVCVGTWKERADIRDILSQLLVCCRSKEKVIKVQSLRMIVERAYLGASKTSDTWSYDWTMQTK